MPAMIRALSLCLLASASLADVAHGATPTTMPFHRFVLDYDTPTDPALQQKIKALDAALREKHGMTPEHAAVGLLDLANLRLAMTHPDRIEYAASVPKVAILLAYFELHPEAVANLDPAVKHELGQMVKRSSNEAATKFSKEIGLKRIQEVLNRYNFYDAAKGGGIWMGKHYGKGGERIGDPVADHSHAATVRQLLRFYLMLEQGKLVSPEASRAMRELFASPDIPQDDSMFVLGLKGRDVQVIRKWGGWEDWHHDTAVVTGPGRHYVLVALTKHPSGQTYLTELAPVVDDLMQERE